MNCNKCKHNEATVKYVKILSFLIGVHVLTFMHNLFTESDLYRYFVHLSAYLQECKVSQKHLIDLKISNNSSTNGAHTIPLSIFHYYINDIFHTALLKYYTN